MLLLAVLVGLRGDNDGEKAEASRVNLILERVLNTVSSNSQ